MEAWFLSTVSRKWKQLELTKWLRYINKGTTRNKEYLPIYQGWHHAMWHCTPMGTGQQSTAISPFIWVWLMKLSASHLLLELQVDGLHAAAISCSISFCVTLRKFHCSIIWKLFAVICAGLCRCDCLEPLLFRLLREARRSVVTKQSKRGGLLKVNIEAVSGNQRLSLNSFRVAFVYTFFVGVFSLCLIVYVV